MNARMLIRGLSKALMGAGAIIFFWGDRALREFWHLRFAPAELIGIGGGILLLVLGAMIQSASSAPAKFPAGR